MVTRATKKAGFTLIEVLVSIAVSAIVIVSITYLNSRSLALSAENLTTLRANMYLVEGIEAAKDLAASNWSKITGAPCTSSGSPCSVNLSASTHVWSLNSGSELLNTLFTRKIWIEKISRDRCSPYPTTIQSGGTECSDDSRKVVATIEWTDNQGPHTQTLEAYVYHF